MKDAQAIVDGGPAPIRLLLSNDTIARVSQKITAADAEPDPQHTTAVSTDHANAAA